ncbi:MAG TPA: MBL fold metallo-hydrolase [Burkholderiaceae bacterium]|nr:MBL fold metallo-hydrolase [Burkholderiaceae bacterium]
MLRFSSLASGSSGNATLVEVTRADGQAPTRLLVDCGLGPRRVAAALAVRGVAPSDLSAIFVTHEHSDHAGGIAALQRRYALTVWASAGTRSAAWDDPSVEVSLAASGRPIVIGALTVHPFAVPHDAAEPLQLVVSDGVHRLGIVTDLGEPTDAVAAALEGCDALLLECNHDGDMLERGPYPAWLKRRIGGARGHLANRQAADLLDRVAHDGLRHVVAAHLSRHNNRPELALAALHAASGRARPQLHVADMHAGCPWIDLAGA